jgi:hypothetical protein
MKLGGRSGMTGISGLGLHGFASLLFRRDSGLLDGVDRLAFKVVEMTDVVVKGFANDDVYGNAHRLCDFGCLRVIVFEDANANSF